MTVPATRSRLLLRTVRHTVETALVVAGLAGLARFVHRRDSLVLAFHNILGPDEPLGGDRPLHLRIGQFEHFLDDVTRTHDVVPLAALRESRARGARPRLAITFDDAYRGAVTLGAAALLARRLPATIFVAPGILGALGMWWDLLASADAGLDRAHRLAMLRDYRGDPQRILAAHPPAADAPRYPIATQAELTAVAGQPGITVAPHSWSHRDLTQLDGDDLFGELEKPLVWLRDRFSDVASWLAYPYGVSAQHVAAAARGAGYECAFEAQYAWVTEPLAGHYALGRYTVGNNTTLARFRTHCAGFRLTL